MRVFFYAGTLTRPPRRPWMRMSTSALERASATTSAAAKVDENFPGSKSTLEKSFEAPLHIVITPRPATPQRLAEARVCLNEYTGPAQIRTFEGQGVTQRDSIQRSHLDEHVFSREGSVCEELLVDR